MVLRMKNFIEGGLPKKGAFDSLRGGTWQERGGAVFEGGVDTLMRTMLSVFVAAVVIKNIPSNAALVKLTD